MERDSIEPKNRLLELIGALAAGSPNLHLIVPCVDQLLLIKKSLSLPRGSARAFTSASSKAVADELAAIRKHAKKLAHLIESLRQDTILALANIPQQDRSFLIADMRSSFPKTLRSLADAANLAKNTDLARRARGLTSDDNDGRGRPANPGGLAANVLHHYYVKITGKNPTMGGDAQAAFPRLVAEVFEAIGIPGNADYAARKAISDAKKVVK